MEKEYTPIEEILNKKNSKKEKNNLKTFDFFTGNGGNILEKEKDLEFKKKLFECNYKINEAFEKIMSSSLSVKSDEESISEKEKLKLVSTAKKNKEKQKYTINKFTFDQRKDLTDLGINLINAKEKKFSTRKTLINCSKFTKKFSKISNQSQILLSNKTINDEDTLLNNSSVKNKDKKSIYHSSGLDFFKNSNNKNTFQTAFSLNSPKQVIQENFRSNKNKKLNPEDFRKINDLKNIMNKNVFYKTFNSQNRNLLHSRESRNIQTPLTSNLSKFEGFNQIFINEKIKSPFRKSSLDRFKNNFGEYNLKNEKILKEKNKDLNKYKQNENEYLWSESNNGEENKEFKDNYLKFCKNNAKLNFNENDSDEEYDKEMLKNKKNIIKKRDTIKKIISKPESFDMFLYNKEKKDQKEKRLNQEKQEEKNRITSKNESKRKKGKKENSKNKSKKQNEKFIEQTKIDYKDSDGNSHKVFNEIKTANRQNLKSSQFEKNESATLSNLKNTEPNSRFTNIIEIKSKNKELYEIQEYTQRNLNRNFSGNETKKIQSLREKLITPCSNETIKNSINPHNIIRSMNKIKNSTQKITKSFSNNFKKYKNFEKLVEKKEDEGNIHLKLPKKTNKIRKNVFMISSSVEEQRKNFTHLSENKRNLLQIADFIESMNDKIVVNLKDELQRQYKKSAEKIGLIELSEIMNSKMGKIFKRENKLNEIILKSKQMENQMKSTRGNIERKYFNKKNK